MTVLAEPARAAAGAAGRAALGRRTLVVVFVAALAVRVVYCLVVLRYYVPQADADHYSRIAASVARGDGFSATFPYAWMHPTAFRPPLYPLLLGAVYAVTGPRLGAAQALNATLGAGVVVLVAVVADRLAGRRAALAAALLAAVYPPLLANDGPPLSEPLALLLMLLAVLALVDRRWVAAGVASGLLVLTRPSAQLFVLVVAAWLLLRVDRRRALLYVATALVVVAPWVVRNQVVLGHPVLVTSNGFNLAAVWSPLALRERHFTDPVRDSRFAALRDYQRRPDHLDEASLDAAFRREGLRGLRSQPGMIPSVLKDNVLFLFDVKWRTNDDAERLDGRDVRLRHLGLPLVWTVTAVGVAGLRRRAGAWALLLCAVYFPLVGVATVSPPRLRAPLDVCCCVGVGAVASASWSRRVAHRRPGPAAA